MIVTRTTKETIKNAMYERQSFKVANDVYSFNNAIEDITNPIKKAKMRINENDAEQLKTLKQLILNGTYTYHSGQEVIGMYSYSDYKCYTTSGLRVINLYDKDDKLVNQITIYWC